MMSLPPFSSWFGKDPVLVEIPQPSMGVLVRAGLRGHRSFDFSSSYIDAETRASIQT
jgi:hypothetical protein